MKYEEKRAEIREFLATNHFPGKRIPTEKELASRFDTNLGMVREILREFETLGIIHKRSRQGIFLNSSVLHAQARVDGNNNFLALIQDQGYKVTVVKEVLFDSCTLDEEACHFLGDYHRGELVCFHMIYYADGKPAIVCYYYCPKLLFGDVDWKAIAKDTDKINEQIRKGFPQYDHSVIHLMPQTVPEEVSSELQVGKDVPIQLWKEAYYNIYDELTQVSFNYLNPDYMNLTFIRKRTDTLSELAEEAVF